MAVEVVQVKDLPIITKEVDINLDDRVVVSHLFDVNTRASTSMTMKAFIDKMLHDIADGIVNKRLHGATDPSSELGTNGDLYFKLVDGTITATFVKYEGEWVKM